MTEFYLIKKKKIEGNEIYRDDLKPITTYTKRVCKKMETDEIIGQKKISIK